MKGKIRSLLLCLFLLKHPVIFSQNWGWTAPPEADKIINPLSGSQCAPTVKQLFVSNCVPCHGNKGKGDGAAGAFLPHRPANLVGKKTESQSDGALFWKITNGHTPMPAFKDTLTETQRWELVAYIRLLEQRANEEVKVKK